MAELFSDDNNEAPTKEEQSQINSYFEELVGEGKPFSDPEALAKGKYEADRFVTSLQRENAEMREELTKKLSVEESVDMILSRMNPADRSNDQNNSDGENNNQGQDNSEGNLKETDVRTLVQNSFEEMKQEATRKSNIDNAASELEKAWGESWQYKLNQRSKELEVSKEFLTEIAAKNPRTFMKIVLGDNKPSVDSQAPPASSSAPAPSRPNANVKNKSYYDSLKRSDPKQYWTSKVQSEMHQNAMALGVDFYQ